ncbi:MAG TPA: OsmC family protein [Candidatus Dormibacteraeota bacterium]|nr:OsmC family protein [Candidatus Dormibacteraeota bacterium]
MDAQSLRGVQAPLKERYRTEPQSALVTLRARGSLGAERVTCNVETARALVEAGLHPATGGDGGVVCSGDMLLQALVACAGVTLAAVASALGILLRGGTVSAEGMLDFRGTLGIGKDVPVGFQAIRLHFDLDTDASREQVETLHRLTERYCVVYQTLKHAPDIAVSMATADARDGS